MNSFLYDFSVSLCESAFLWGIFLPHFLIKTHMNKWSFWSVKNILKYFLNIEKGCIHLFYWMMLAIVFSILWKYYFLFDLFTHFSLQYFFSAILMFFVFLIRKNYTYMVLASVVIVYLSFMVTWTKIMYGWNIENPKIYFLNANYFNQNSDPIVEDIVNTDADVIWLVEINEELFDKLKNRLDYEVEYYYRDWVMSYAFFSKHPIKKMTNIRELYPIWIMKLYDGSYFYIIHPLPPITAHLSNSQKNLFRRVSELLQEHHKKWEKFVLVWDFNSTKYSNTFQKYFWEYNYQAVHSWIVRTIMSLPIDYIISNYPLQIEWWNFLTSDHIPILAK